MNVLIIGGAGYIGSRVSEYLISKEILVSIVDCNWFGYHKNINISRVDFADNLSESYIQNFDAVVLFFGHSSVGMSNGVIESAMNNNVISVTKLLRKLLPHQLFIYSSSSSVYGNTNTELVDETWVNGIAYTEYDLTKKALDDFMQIQSIHKNWWGLRYATVCGGSVHLRTDLMMNMMYHTSQTENKIYAFGGKVNRSILYILDLAKAVYNILVAPKQPGIYNLSSFHSTNYEIASVMSDILQTPVEQKHSSGINKTTSSRYDYKISSKKYESVYLPIGQTYGDFLCAPTNIETVIKDLQIYYPIAVKTNRENPIVHL